MSGGKIGKAISGIGKGIGGAVGGVLGALGGNSGPNIKTREPRDIAQDEVDEKQKTTNAALARKKNRSLLSTGAASLDSGGAKKLLGD